jgi:hypothetical protein
MTSEICIMNRHAIALAADSATTVTQQVNGKTERRFFKGANKIFQISDYHPIGLMIYGTADLNRVPWEVIVKEFRRTFGRKAFNTIDGYAQEFSDFIAGHPNLFPAEHKVKAFRSDAFRAAAVHLQAVQRDAKYRAATSDDEKNLYASEYFQKKRDELQKINMRTELSESDLTEAMALYFDELSKDLTPDLAAMNLDGIIDNKLLAELAILALYKQPEQVKPETGVVIAGFGDHQHLPSYSHYLCHGLLIGKLLFKKESEATVSFDEPSHIDAFATTAMVNTFSLGFSPDLFTEIRSELYDCLRIFAENIRSISGSAAIPDLGNLIETTVAEHTKRWTAAAVENHGRPLRRVIGSLPVDEMAELAETLIMLQSLKEKVTQPTESVGGPIDVAIITKGDGFVWIKRKHYFDPTLNPRFFLRQRTEFTSEA